MTRTLYNRLGELKGITKLVDDVVNLHMVNPHVSPRFIPYKDQPERLMAIKQHTVHFFCAGAGGPQEYKGRDMVSTHKGMNISEQEFLAAVDDILEAMDKNNFGDEDKKDVLAILYSLKGGVIRL
ncbi:group 1 truncated hemoglobin [Arenibacter sp. TNZ]|jgi:hemoglobin|uniref:group I truncated hemoglobin n=1 Tax=Arenibacter TaxID=178469 RepID=UPI000CD4797E|nr:MULTISPECIES: group 1 truncated hemoglobin [Arenibacter]MCM4171657.1 group 1 truncated hemoglobin [Arenibacter sp. TNZ]